MKRFDFKKIKEAISDKMKDSFGKGWEGNDSIIESLLPIVGELSDEQKEDITSALRSAHEVWDSGTGTESLKEVTSESIYIIYRICCCEKPNDKWAMNFKQLQLKFQLEENRLYKIYESKYKNGGNYGKMEVYVDKSLRNISLNVSLDRLVLDLKKYYRFSTLSSLIEFIKNDPDCQLCTGPSSDENDFEKTIRNYWTFILPKPRTPF